MLQRLHIGFGVALLAAASLQAPFAHLHTGEPDHHHGVGFVHAHLELAHLQESSQPEMEAHDDDEATINIDWAPTEAKRITVAYVGPIASVPLQPIYVRQGTAPEFTARSNSPPRRLLLPARAPPA